MEPGPHFIDADAYAVFVQIQSVLTFAALLQLARIVPLVVRRRHRVWLLVVILLGIAGVAVLLLAMLVWNMVWLVEGGRSIDESIDGFFWVQFGVPVVIWILAAVFPGLQALGDHVRRARVANSVGPDQAVP